jgi:hypothetical protein
MPDDTGGQRPLGRQLAPRQPLAGQSRPGLRENKTAGTA